MRLIHSNSAGIVSERVWFALAVAATLLGTNHTCLPATATNRPAATGPADRHLIIVDMSSSMERNAENMQRIIGQLMSSGIAGEARAGDTIGIWTFNEVLQTGTFPLQRWTPQTRQRITTAAVEFLGRQRYEKRSRFEKVVEPLTEVIKASEKITVLIITDGAEKISGTPFDQAINESYRLNYEMQRKQRMPFITVLRAQDGEFIGWRVNAPPFRPEFPPFPVEPKVIAESEPEPQPTTAIPPTPPTPAPSLVVLGEPPATVAPTSTNTPTAGIVQPPATQTPDSTGPSAQPKPDAQPSVPAESPATRTPVPEPPVAVTPVEPPKSDPQPPTPAPAGATPEVASQSPVTDSPAPQPGSASLSESKPAESTPPSSTSQATPVAEPDVPASTVQTALATPAESLFNRTNLLIAGVVLLVVAFGLIYVVVRRAARPSEKISLITRSMDRDQDL